MHIIVTLAPFYCLNLLTSALPFEATMLDKLLQFGSIRRRSRLDRGTPRPWCGRQSAFERLEDRRLLVVVGLNPTAVLEDGPNDLVYTFTRGIADSPGDLIVSFSFSGSATSGGFGSDFTQTGASAFTVNGGTVTIPTGAQTATLRLDPTADLTVEGDDNILLTLEDGAGYTVETTGAVTGTITNDDATPADVALAVNPSRVSEDGNQNLVYTFTRSGLPDSTLSQTNTMGVADWNTNAATPLNQTVTFNSMERLTGVSLQLTGLTHSRIGDLSFELVAPDQNSMFPLDELTGNNDTSNFNGTYTFADSGASIWEEAAQRGDNEIITPGTYRASQPGNEPGSEFPISFNGTFAVGGRTANGTWTLRMRDRNPAADSGGLTSWTLTLETAAASIANPLTVNFNVAGSATLNTDYTGTSTGGVFAGPNGTARFDAGMATTTVTVDPTADGNPEPDETVALTLQAGAGYNVRTGGAVTGTITESGSPNPFTATVVSPTEVRLNWNNAPGETGYVIYQSTGNGSMSIGSVGPDITTFTVRNLTPDTFYRFLIRMTTAAGSVNSVWRNLVTTTAAPTGSPNPLMVTLNSPTSATLNWNNVVNESGYVVYQSTGNGAFTIGSTLANVTTFTVNNLAPNSFNRFLVTSINQNGQTRSRWQSIVTNTGQPTSPNPLLSSVASETRVLLSWNDADNETGYVIYQSNNDGNGSFSIGSTLANVTNFQVDNLTAGTFYRFLVLAVNQNGRSQSMFVDAMTFGGAMSPRASSVVSDRLATVDAVFVDHQARTDPPVGEGLDRPVNRPTSRAVEVALSDSEFVHSLSRRGRAQSLSPPPPLNILTDDR